MHDKLMRFYKMPLQKDEIKKRKLVNDNLIGMLKINKQVAEYANTFQAMILSSDPINNLYLRKNVLIGKQGITYKFCIPLSLASISTL